MRTSLITAILLVFLSLSGGKADDIKAWPFVYQNTDPETQTFRAEYFWPFYVHESTSDYAAYQFLSFPQTFSRDYPHQFYFLWPLSGFRTGAGHDAWAFPFYWSGSEQGRNNHYLAVFPVFYYGQKRSETTLNLALLQHNHWDRNGSGHYLFPLFWKSRYVQDRYRDESFGLLPIIWMSQTQEGRVVYQENSRQYNSRAGGLFLLNWWTRLNETNRAASGFSVVESVSDNLFPVFSRGRSSRITLGSETARHSDDSLWVLPYWQSHKIRNNRAGKEEEARHRFFPFYWDWNETRNGRVDTGRVLFPLWWHSATLETGTVSKSADFLVPLGAHFYKKDEYDTRNILGPMFNRTENTRTQTVRYDAFFPFFSFTRGREESGGHVFPLAGWSTARGQHDNLWYGFPLGWNCESQEQFDYRMSRPQLFGLHELETRPVVAEADCREGPRRTVAFYPFYWSKRQADEQHEGILPLYWLNSHRYGRSLSRETGIPLLLGDLHTVYRDDIPVYSHQNYLLSLIAHGRGADSKQWRVFPLFSYNRSGGSLDYSSFIVPFSYESWRDSEHPDRAHSSALSVPFSFLPLYKTQTSQSETAGSERKSWFFPLYKREQTTGPAGEHSKLSILWPLWNGEWVNDETRIRGLGGVMNFYERDAGGFVEQRLLYRVFTRRTRSWFNEHELMPFYAQSAREDGQSSWSVLGGLIGGGCDGARNYMRLMYIRIPTRAVPPVAPEAHAEKQKQHADLALNYLRHDRYDRAAIEFALAGPVGSNDAPFQLAAGEAYLKAEPDALGKELRSSIPSSLDPIYGKSGRGNTRAIQDNLLTLAVARFENALRLGADKPSTLCKLAAALNALERRTEALMRLEEADRLKPEFSTAMLRMETSEAIMNHNRRRDDHAARATQDAARALLGELKARYPGSPTLALKEAALLQRSGNRGPLLVYDTDVSHRWVPDKEVFSTTTMQELEIYRKGAASAPGGEERIWLESGDRKDWSARGRWRFAMRSSSFIPPEIQCARNAVSILNRQMSALIGAKKYAEALALKPPIFQLLPKTCIRCPLPENESGTLHYDAALEQALGNLYKLNITITNRPLDYIAAVEELAPTLCRHCQPKITNALDSVRLEQQYIKTWRITGEVDGQQVTRDYTGKFFERYTDLDALLNRPDQCTAKAECVVTSPEARRVILRLGFDHTLTAKLNGQVVFGPITRKIAARDEYRVPLTLKAGKNRLSLQVTDDTLAYGFFARLSSEKGEFMRDIVIDAGEAELRATF